MRRFVLGIVISGLVAVTPAEAATIHGESFEERGRVTRWVAITAAPGEANHIVVARHEAADLMVVTDLTADVQPSGLCIAAGPRSVICPRSPILAWLGDLADRFPSPRGISGSVTIYGGPGDDVLEAGPVGSSLYGEEGADHLVNPGPGFVAGGPGDDRLLLAESGSAAHFTCGAGADVVVRDRDHHFELQESSAACESVTTVPLL